MSGPVYVMGGNPVQPGDATFISYVSGVNWPVGTSLELFWPFSFTSTGNPVRTTMSFNTPDNPGTVILPKATEAAPGQSFIMWNLGNHPIDVKKQDGTTVFQMESDLVYWVVLEINTTEAGIWGVVQYGAGTSGGTASTLAGYGLIPLDNGGQPQTLNVDFKTELKLTPFTLALSDWSATMVCRSTCDTITLPELSTMAVPADGFFCYIYNNRGTPVVLHPETGTILINNSNNDLSILPGFSCMLQFDGNLSYTTIGLETQTGAVTSLYKAPISAGQTYVQLTEAQLANEIIVLETSGAPLTNDVTIYFSNVNNKWTVHNLTLSPYNIILRGGSLATPIGSTYVLPNGQATTFYVNSEQASLYVIDDIAAVPNSADLIPLSTEVAGTTYGTARWGGVSILDNNFAIDGTPITITPNLAILSSGFAGDISGHVVIEGVIYVSPATSPSTTTLTIQKKVNGGAYQDLSSPQGAVPIFNTSAASYDPTDLIPVSFKTIDFIDPAETNVVYYVLGTLSGGTAKVNVARSGGITGVSTLFVTLYGQSAFS